MLLKKDSEALKLRKSELFQEKVEYIGLTFITEKVGDAVDRTTAVQLAPSASEKRIWIVSGYLQRLPTFK